MVVSKAWRSDGGAENVLMSDVILSVNWKKYFRNRTMLIWSLW